MLSEASNFLRDLVQFIFQLTKHIPNCSHPQQSGQTTIPFQAGHTDDTETGARKLLATAQFGIARKHQGWVWMFFVGKKDGRLRRILDPWLVELIARCSSKVSICTPKVLEHIDLPVRKSYLETACFVLPETPATTGMSDVSDCFHRLLVDDDLSDYFALEHDFTASDFGLTGHVFGGRELQTAVWVALRSLPVKFSWSLYFTPETNSHQLSEVQTASSFRLLNDRQSAAVRQPDETKDQHNFACGPLYHSLRPSTLVTSRNCGRDQTCTRS